MIIVIEPQNVLRALEKSGDCRTVADKEKTLAADGVDFTGSAYPTAMAGLERKKQ